MDELVKRLRAAKVVVFKAEDVALLGEAADAIEGLSAIREEQKAQIILMAAEIGDQKPRWIPVTERLPEDGSDILAVQSYCGEVRIIPANYDRGVWYDCVFNRVAEHITHWMPLPQPPKEET